MNFIAAYTKCPQKYPQSGNALRRCFQGTHITPMHQEAHPVFVAIRLLALSFFKRHCNTLNLNGLQAGIFGNRIDKVLPRTVDVV